MNELIQKYTEFLADPTRISDRFSSFMVWLMIQQNKIPTTQCQHRYLTDYINPTSTGTIDPNICMICGLKK